MGRKLDALFGRRNFRTPKLKPLVNLSISRLAVLKNQKQARCSLVRTDIVELLKLGHHDPALVRVEQVIKEQNMLDVFAMIETYCHLLAERISLIEQEKGCPEELNEALSSLIYASTRCGEFPELVELRAVFASRYGKEFVARAVELRNNCGMIQKLSTRQPSLENRVKVLEEIASENNIVLQIQEASSVTEGNIQTEHKLHQPKQEPSMFSSGSMGGNGFYTYLEDMESLEGSSRKYKDVADAAEAAFKSAAYAAAAARAAVELSRSQSHDPDDRNSPGTSPGKREVKEEQNEVKSESTDESTLSETGNKNGAPKPNQSALSESDEEVLPSAMVHGSEMSKTGMPGPSVIRKTEPMKKGIKFDGSDDETGNSYTFVDEERYGSDDVKMKSRNKFFLRSEAGLEEDLEPVNAEDHTDRYTIHSAKSLNLQKRPSSVRTRKARGI